MNKYLEKVAGKTAVIVTGNPGIISDPEWKDLADTYYSDVSSHLRSKGFDVTMDPGLDFTLPPKADVWIGHSRGVGRLRFATPGTITIPMGDSAVGAVNHPNDTSLKKGDPLVKEHFMLTRGMKKEMNKYLEKIADATDSVALPRLGTNIPYLTDNSWMRRKEAQSKAVHEARLTAESYLNKIAESSDYSWLVPAASVTVPIAAGGVAQYAALKTKDKFETKPEQRLLNKALRNTALKSTLGLSLAGGTAAGLAEFSRRKYLENQKDQQNLELKQALRTTIRQELN